MRSFVKKSGALNYKTKLSISSGKKLQMGQWDASVGTRVSAAAPKWGLEDDGRDRHTVLTGRVPVSAGLPCDTK